MVTTGLKKIYLLIFKLKYTIKLYKRESTVKTYDFSKLCNFILNTFIAILLGEISNVQMKIQY